MRTKLFIIAGCSVLLLAACGKPRTTEEDKILEIQEYTTVMQEGKEVIDPVHGKRTGFWYGAVMGVDGTNANGIAYIHLFEDGASRMTVNLNILPADKGTHFEAYLTDAEGKGAIAISELASIIGDARHAAKIETTEDIADKRTIEVRLVKNGASTVVARGTLKAPTSAVPLN